MEQGAQLRQARNGRGKHPPIIASAVGYNRGLPAAMGWPIETSLTAAAGETDTSAVPRRTHIRIDT